MKSKGIYLLSITLFLGIILMQGVYATEFDTFTLQIADLIKIFIALMGLIIIVFATWSFFAGGPSFLRLVVIMFYIGLVLLIILIFVPILIGHISSTVG